MEDVSIQDVIPPIPIAACILPTLRNQVLEMLDDCSSAQAIVQHNKVRQVQLWKTLKNTRPSHRDDWQTTVLVEEIEELALVKLIEVEDKQLEQAKHIASIRSSCTKHADQVISGIKEMRSTLCAVRILETQLRKRRSPNDLVFELYNVSGRLDRQIAHLCSSMGRLGNSLGKLCEAYQMQPAFAAWTSALSLTDMVVKNVSAGRITKVVQSLEETWDRKLVPNIQWEILDTATEACLRRFCAELIELDQTVDEKEAKSEAWATLVGSVRITLPVVEGGSEEDEDETDVEAHGGDDEAVDEENETGNPLQDADDLQM